MGTLRTWWWKVLLGGIALVAGFFVFIIFQPLTKKFDESDLPQFIQADFIELDKIFSISTFRSGIGHDFSSGSETCRSMKHYFNVQQNEKTSRQMQQYTENKTFPEPDPTTAIKIFSPVDGKITAIESEQFPLGQQIWIKPSSYPQFTIRLFHIYPLPHITDGAKVAAGEHIGMIHEYQNTDIAVQTGTPINPQFYSYFAVMPDSVFVAYQTRGAKTREDFIISREERDSRPLKCNGEQFAEHYDDGVNAEHFVRLSGYQ